MYIHTRKHLAGARAPGLHLIGDAKAAAQYQTTNDFALVHTRMQNAQHTAMLVALLNHHKISVPPAFSRGGEVIGPGSGTSDDIVARLSDGEYILPAADVLHLGGGNREKAMTGSPNLISIAEVFAKPRPDHDHQQRIPGRPTGSHRCAFQTQGAHTCSVTPLFLSG